jgi:mannose/fructose-specific phosphotransferase system component IIA
LVWGGSSRGANGMLHFQQVVLVAGLALPQVLQMIYMARSTKDASQVTARARAARGCWHW